MMTVEEQIQAIVSFIPRQEWGKLAEWARERRAAGTGKRKNKRRRRVRAGV